MPTRLLAPVAVALAAVAALSAPRPHATNVHDAMPRSSAASGDSLSSVVDQLFAAMRRSDTIAVRAAFVTGGRVIIIPATPAAALTTLSVDDFVRFAGRNAPEFWTERMWNPVSSVNGRLGVLWFEYEIIRPGEPVQCGVNSVQLQQTPDGWKIASMAFTARRGDCPERKPG